MPGTRHRGHDHRQQETQLVAQSLPRPVINDLIQVLLSQRTTRSRNSSEVPGEVSGGLRATRPDTGWPVTGATRVMTRARSFWTINGTGTLILYGDRARPSEAHQSGVSTQISQ
jgi:hypothetical protein